MTEYLQYQGQLYRTHSVVFRTDDFTIYELSDEIDLNGPVRFLALTRNQLIYSVGVLEWPDEDVLIECHGKGRIITL
ncbi:hypothetical protein [Oceanospirillum sediminis]|uniref:Uncharacterized protein n=1 Tax=Oceanospirillum sediminis TaxID=2760088 RepID=A0A839IWA3_9GAMM|nr:hypothetical protein [Oceanospirillum sediminis]MBB1488657.1 hypothetical protein [Oceanospirillum sediminis]